MRIKTTLSGLLLAGLMVATSIAQAVPTYSVTALGLDGIDFLAPSTGINDSGQVVGYGGPPNSEIRPYLYSNGTITYLDIPGGGSSIATGINNSGQVVGNTYVGDKTYPFIYSNGITTVLEILVGGWNYTTGINDRGDVIGEYQPIKGGGRHHFLYSNGTVTDISFGVDRGCPSSEATGINNSGQVV